MHRCSGRAALSVWTAVALSAVACSSDPKPGTPAAAAEGERLMRQMSDTLARRPEFRFTTAESLEQIGPTARTARVAVLTHGHGSPARRHVLRIARGGGHGGRSGCLLRRPDHVASARTPRRCGRRRMSQRQDSTGCWTTSPSDTRCPCPSPTWSTVCPTTPSSAGARKAGSPDRRPSTASGARAWSTPTTSWRCGSGYPRRVSRCPGGKSWSTSRRQARRRRASISRAWGPHAADRGRDVQIPAGRSGETNPPRGVRVPAAVGWATRGLRDIGSARRPAAERRGEVPTIGRSCDGQGNTHEDARLGRGDRRGRGHIDMGARGGRGTARSRRQPARGGGQSRRPAIAASTSPAPRAIGAVIPGAASPGPRAIAG